MASVQLANILDSVQNVDCLDLFRAIPNDSIDLVVSSPPYNLGKEYESRRALEHYLADQAIVLREIHRVLKDTGSVFWQVGAYSENGALIPLDIKFFPIFESLGMVPRNRIIWARQHGLHASRKFSARHETILWFTKTEHHKFSLDAIRVPQKYQNKKSYRGDEKGAYSCNPDGKNPGDIWLFRNVKHNHEEQTIHPCQFPEDMIARIVLSVTDQGDIVLDPYMGAGTVAVVARDYGRRYIGAELEFKYYDVTRRRLSGLPDSNNSFPNLKTLRDYIEKTGEPTEKYTFDVQVGRTASTRDKAKIFSEEHHLNEMLRRLEFEEETFSARSKGAQPPDDSGFVLKPSSAENPQMKLPL